MAVAVERHVKAFWSAKLRMWAARGKNVIL